MMKKMIPILLTMLLLFSETVYAENITPAIRAQLNPPKAKVVTQKPGMKRRLPQRQDSKEWAAAKAEMAQVHANANEIAQLKGEAIVAYRKAKSRVRELMKNQDSLTDEQIAELKQAAANLSKDRGTLESSSGDIRGEVLKLKSAERNRDLKAYEDAMNTILTIQKTWIDALKAIIDDLNSIAAL